MTADLLPATISLAQVRGLTARITDNLLVAGGVPGPLGTVTQRRPLPYRTIGGPTLHGRFGPAVLCNLRHRTCHDPDPCQRPEAVCRDRPLPPEERRAPVVPEEVRPEKPRGLPPPWRMPLPIEDAPPLQPAARPADKHGVGPGRRLDVLA